MFLAPDLQKSCQIFDDFFAFVAVRSGVACDWGTQTGLSGLPHKKSIDFWVIFSMVVNNLSLQFFVSVASD